MNYAKIKKVDIANGPGVRVSLFVSGCRRRCRGCFNPETWDFSYGSAFTEATVAEIVEALDRSYIKGLSILGGEPFEMENIGMVRSLVEGVYGRFEHKSIWLYTGYLLEELVERGDNDTMTVLRMADVLVEGPFEERSKVADLRFRGSTNQRILDLGKSMGSGPAVEWEDPFWDVDVEVKETEGHRAWNGNMKWS